MAKRKTKYKWKWKDEESKGVVEASELHVGALRIIVHRYHGEDPTQWFLTCYDLRIERSKLLKPGTSLEDAKAHALVAITEHVDELHELLHAHD